MASPLIETKKIKALVRGLSLGQAAASYLATLCHLAFLLVLCQALGGAFGNINHPALLPLISLPWAIFMLISLAILRGLFGTLEGPLGNRAATLVVGHFRGRLEKACGRQASGRGAPGGAFASLYHDGAQALGPWVSGYFPAQITAAAVPLTVLAVALWVDPLTALTLALAGPLVPVFMILIGQLTRDRNARQVGELAALSGRLGELIQGLPTLVPLGRSEWARRQLEKASARHARTTLEVLRVAFLSALVLEWLTTLSTAVVAVESGLRLLKGSMALEGALFAILLAPEFFGPLRQLGLKFHASTDGRGALEKILEYEQESSPENETSAHLPWPGTQANAGTNPSPPSHPPCLPLVSRGLSFQWDERDEALFSNVHIHLGPGSLLALSGPSGCGKSTLTRILMKLETPGGRVTAGQITAGSIDLNEIPGELWHRQVMWLPQHPRVFAGSLREHFTRSFPMATDAGMIHALGEAGLGAWYQTQERGLDTPVGEGGTRLSGGERQRLALARCLMKDAPILILDEFTAHLDPALEEELLARLKPLFPSKAVLLVSHRPMTLALAKETLHFRRRNPQPFLEKEPA